MAEERTEIVRRQLESWNEGDLERSLSNFHPDVVVIAPEGWPEGPVVEGIEAWRLQIARLRDTWGEARAEIEELRAIGDAVVARFRYVTEGESQAISFDTPMGAVFRFEGEKIVRAEYFWSFDEALAAAGR